ncbi:MAG TPA: hypothetical protein VK071_03575 [Tissierellales bacterium]|nr:hypothetical protein [Tissierellales bacterium]
MRKLFHGLEIVILILTVISMLFLVFIQIISPSDMDIVAVIGKHNNGNEFTPMNKLNINEKGIVILKLLNNNLEDIKILVNGDEVDNFQGNDEVSIQVYNNDLIEIDGTKYLERVKVQIIGISENLKLPELDTTIETSQSIEMLGRVKLK